MINFRRAASGETFGLVGRVAVRRSQIQSGALAGGSRGRSGTTVVAVENSDEHLAQDRLRAVFAKAPVLVASIDAGRRDG
jgi:hypothetical protein